MIYEEENRHQIYEKNSYFGYFENLYYNLDFLIHIIAGKSKMDTLIIDCSRLN